MYHLSSTHMQAHACIHANSYLFMMAKNNNRFYTFTLSHTHALFTHHYMDNIVVKQVFSLRYTRCFSLSLSLSLSLLLLWASVCLYKACLKNVLWLHGILSTSFFISRYFLAFFCYTKIIYSYIEMYRGEVKIFWGKSCSSYFKKKLLLVFVFVRFFGNNLLLKYKLP